MDHDPPTISQLIQARIDRHDDNPTRIAARSRHDNHQVTQKYVWTLLAGQAGYFPRKPETISALARGLETTELAVLIGFAREFGLNVTAPRFATTLPAEVDNLHPHVQASIVGMLRALTATPGDTSSEEQQR